MQSIVIKALKFKAALEWEDAIPENLKVGLLMSEKAKIFKSAIKSLKDKELFYSKLQNIKFIRIALSNSIEKCCISIRLPKSSDSTCRANF